METLTTLMNGKTKKVVLLAASIILLSQISALAQCFREQFSGLPHSFTGVDRCGDNDTWNSEAQNRCLRLARENFRGARVFLSGSPAWRGDITEEDNCTRRVAGVCVDRARSCRASSQELTCFVEICR